MSVIKPAKSETGALWGLPYIFSADPGGKFTACPAGVCRDTILMLLNTHVIDPFC